MTDTPTLRPRFWDLPLDALTRTEWEALCDGCAKCCLIKLADEDTDEVRYTRVACRLLDRNTCRCTNYALRQQIVPECLSFDRATLERIAYWLPATCAYRRLYQGEALPEWHPLLTGDPESVHRAGVSWRGRMLAEAAVPEDALEDHFIEDQT